MRSRKPIFGPFSLALRCALSALLLIGGLPAMASGKFINLVPKTKSEVQLILNTLEAGISDDRTDQPAIVMMLHGREAERFLRHSYPSNKMLIDQTAKLSAYRVIDVQICEAWMRKNDYSKDDLFPFISTVPFAPAELKRLEDKEGYTEYDVDL
ncbi:MAG: hypothetical protein AAF513_01425 [Pseudomonadota bacterium]